MTETKPFRWINLWLGALVAGILGFAVFVAGSFLPLGPGFPVVILGIVFALAVVGLGYWLHRGANTELALGLVGGYAVLSLISGGECTMFVTGQSGEVGVLAGFFLYPLGLALALIVGAIVYAVTRIVASRNKEGQ